MMVPVINFEIKKKESKEERSITNSITIAFWLSSFLPGTNQAELIRKYSLISQASSASVFLFSSPPLPSRPLTSSISAPPSLRLVQFPFHAICFKDGGLTRLNLYKLIKEGNHGSHRPKTPWRPYEVYTTLYSLSLRALLTIVIRVNTDNTDKGKDLKIVIRGKH